MKKESLSKNRLGKCLPRTVCRAGVFVLGFCIIADAAAFFEYASIDFTKDTPSDLGIPDAYPEGLVTTPQGVPFNIGPVGGNAIWCPGGCAGFGVNDTYSMTAPVGLSGLHTVYTLMNTVWEAPGQTLTKVEFKFDGITTPYFAMLTDGDDLRDGLTRSSINGVSTVPAFHIPVGVHGVPWTIDMQAFSIPDFLWDNTLTDITFITDRTVFQHGIFLWGITASTLDHVTPGAISLVPEPETYAMLLAGLGLIGFMARRRKGTTIYSITGEVSC